MGRYTDEFRASAIVMLRAEGYPQQRGALAKVAEYLHVHYSVLSRWYRSMSNPPPRELAQIKKDDLIGLIKSEIQLAFHEMHSARADAEYKELGTVIGILVDKMQLLQGEPTERHELTVEERSSRVAALLDAARERRTGQPASVRTDD